MESINFFEGYSKVNNLEDQSKYPPKRHRRLTIALSLAVFLTLIVIVGSLLAVLFREGKESESPQLASDPADSLKKVCAVTRHPDSCFSSVSPLNSPPSSNPLRFFNLSLHASITEVASLKDLLAERKPEPALKDCAELFDDASSQLGRSAESICVGRGEKVLTDMKISDLKTWISAAMTDQVTCLDGLEEMESTALDEFRVKVQRSQEYMSNTLTILNNIRTLFKKFGLAMP
ncbi:hypothetical protein OROHE_011059 [Orobanche hederae]